MKSLVLLIASSLLCGLSVPQIDLAYSVNKQELQTKTEALYLPKKEFVEIISLGYKNTISHLIWFNTISYFGSHYQTDKNYKWLYHMCDLVSSLNPKAKHVYSFCSTMLSWEGNAADKSVALLSNAINENPKEWEYYYLRGFNYMHFLKDPLNAQKDFQQGALLPNAPIFLGRLASKKLAELDNPQAAADFLQTMIKNSKDPTEREALEFRLHQIIDKMNLDVLGSAVEIYRQKYKTYPEDLKLLVKEKIIAGLPIDPWGEKYIFDKNNLVVTSKSESRRLKK
ncbi:MAG: hypothetical protein R3A13_01720 [Bdellovibrionota bacterium]